MSKTVTLPIEEYNSLIEFEREVKNGKNCVKETQWFGGITSYTEYFGICNDKVVCLDYP